MRAFTFLVLIIATTEVANGIGRMLSKRTLAGTCTRRMDCADCTTVNICSYDMTILAQYSCMEADPTKPFCKQGECVEESEGNCSTLANDLCPILAEGYYPDPTNCTRFVYCEQAIGFPQSCLASSNYYSQEKGLCRLKQRSSDCFQVDCKNAKNKDKWFIYTPYPQLYFYCSNAGPLLFECPKNNVFNVNTMRCEFQCPEAGRFEHPIRDMYYECVQVSSSKIQKFEQFCPGSTFKFDPKDQKCVYDNKKEDIQ